MKRINLTGRRFGRLVVTGLADSRNGKAYWHCECDCGGSSIPAATNLLRGLTQSCGCGEQQARCKNLRRTHGGSHTTEYSIWSQMKRRCADSTSKSYVYYGGRGIRVCDAWRDSFETFLADVGPRPSPCHSIDRINNNGNYEPGNVRWATRKEQARNSRHNHLLTFEGRTQPMSAWVEERALTFAALKKRIKRGYTIDRALTTPLRKVVRR